MSENDIEIAVLKSKLESTEQDVAELKGNQRWFVLAIGAALLSKLADYFTKGGVQ